MSTMSGKASFTPLQKKKQENCITSTAIAYKWKTTRQYICIKKYVGKDSDKEVFMDFCNDVLACGKVYDADQTDVTIFSEVIFQSKKAIQKFKT